VRPLHLTIFRDQRRHIIHAVVTVDMGKKRYVLGSLFNNVAEQRYVLKYAPIYSANLHNQFARIISKQLRVAYLNWLEDQEMGRVIRTSVNCSSKLCHAFKRKMKPGHSPNGSDRFQYELSNRRKRQYRIVLSAYLRLI
jgi:hypothetical protein